MADKAYSAPGGLTRGGLISELNIINLRTRDAFFEKWGFVPYIEVQELAGNEAKTENKGFYHYESTRGMGFVVANATVAGANGAAVTVTIAAGGYASSGKRSLPEIGKIFYNAMTGVESRVTAVNKGTDNAHTFTIVPVVSTTSAAVTAGDELQDRGYKYTGERSGATAMTIVPVEKFTNYVTQLRIDSNFSNLALAERIDFEYEGKAYYKYKQLANDNYRWKLQKELLLMDSNLTDNLGYNETGSAGIIQQVQANGINDTYANFSAITTFAQIERKLDAQGGQGEYDFLCDTDAHIDIQTALGQEFNNGAIVYDRSDLKFGFKSFTPMNRKFNFNRYLPFSERALWGGSANGTTRNNFSLLIAKGKGQDAKTKNIRPMLQVRYLEVEGQKVQITEYGGLAPHSKTGIMELNIGQEANMGIDIFGANQMMILKKA